MTKSKKRPTLSKSSDATDTSELPVSNEVISNEVIENQGGSVYGTEVALVSNAHERPKGAPGCFATGETLLREKESHRLFAHTFPSKIVSEHRP